MIKLLRFERQFAGSSFPTQITASDGRQWLLKMQGAGNGSESLIAEFIVNRAAALAGLCVPDVTVIGIEHGFPWQFGTDEFDDILQKSYGANLGIEFIAAETPVAAISQAPKGQIFPDSQMGEEADQSLRQQLFAIDIFFRNFDRTALSGNLLRDRSGKIWIIDHGSCRFLQGQAAVLQLPANHWFAAEPVPAGARDLICKLARMDYAKNALSEIPREWYTEAGLSPESAAETLALRAKAFLSSI